VRIGQLLSGIASGYFTRGIQFVATILLVPFLLRDDVLGLDGYGNVFTMLGIIALFRFSVDGLRVSFTRDISMAMGEREGGSPGATLGTRIKIMFLICTAIVVAVWLAAPVILPIVGIAPDSYALGGLRFAALIFWAENALHLFRVPLIVRGSISFVNFCGAAEVTLRAVTYFLLFSVSEASLMKYFLIQAAFVLARNLAFVVHLAYFSRDDLRGFFRAPWRPSRKSVGYAVPIATVQVTNELVERLPVILASTFLGAEASGLVALVLNTTRRYVRQILFSVLQPIAVPIAARLDPRRLSPSALGTLWNVEALYTLCTALVICSGIVCMPELITIWLGADYAVIVTVTQVLLAASACEIAFRFRQSILLGQGLLGSAVPAIVGIGLLSIAGIALGILVWNSWQGMIVVVAIFLIASNVIGIGRAFWREFADDAPIQPPRYEMVSFLAVATTLALALSHWRLADGSLGGVLAVVIAGLTTLVAAHLLLLPVSEAFTTLTKLRRSLHRDIFASEHTGGTGSA
jgi:O-antigen/teichoic acid export membrane protein